MRSLRLLAPLLVVLVTISAGCADLRGRLEADPEPAYAQVLPWRLDECQFAIAVVAMDPALVGARVPEGFRLLAVEEIPGFPVRDDPRGEGNLGIELFRCASGSGANATENLTEVSYGSVLSFVAPPEHLRDANATHHLLRWDVLVPDDARRQLLRAEGADAMPGNVTFSRFQDVGPLKGVQGLLQMGNASYAFDAAGAPAGAANFTEMRLVAFTPARGALVEWRANLTAPQAQAGVGLVDLADAPEWVRDAAGGSQRAQAYYVTGTGSLANGTIALPWRG